MHRLSQFSLGILAGIAVVLLTLVILQNREPQAHAVAQAVDNAGGNIVMGIGGSQTQMNDVVWILWKHPAPKRPPGADTKDDRDSIISSKDEFLTLCCYQVSNGARSIKLVAARNITFDMDMHEYHNERPGVSDIIAELKRSQMKSPK